MPAPPLPFAPDEFERTFPWPTATLPNQPVFGDLTFDLIDGDFERWKGLWRIQRGQQGPASTWLVYSLFVRPASYLPIGPVVQENVRVNTIENFRAVARHAEAQYRQQAPQQ